MPTIRSRSRRKRVILGAMFASGMIVVASQIISGGIEIAARSQPREPGGIYTTPREIQGTVRYLTQSQAALRLIAAPGLLIGLFGFFALAVPYERLRRREEKEKAERLLTRDG